MGRRSKKSWELYRRRHVGDLGLLFRACCAGKLADADGARRRYLKMVLAMAWLPAPDEIAKQLGFTNAEREFFKTWTIPPIDMRLSLLSAGSKGIGSA
jgi:hypothetical protein